MKVVLLAGGFGTRLSEYTKTIPKPMIDIGGKPMLLHIMQLYAKYGYKDFYIALGYKGEIIKNFFNKKFFDYFSPITQSNIKIFITIFGIQFHNIEKHRFATNINHWFRYCFGILG